ncbi:hypothetical protein FE257_001086 [Aspergillus nanangensis]|uniref:Uncharacterized protein n=1 Tax=Aspergillus nanangensis TaxID=2582783 RepID=A0AAD4CU05_ASPNN|nr:hypothetical protein FE257_001086 [Aspergillus nanangensis]
MRPVIFTLLGVVFSGTLGAVIPEPTSPNHLEAKSKHGVLIKYPGKCYPDTNQCHYDSPNGVPAICKCQFKMCTNQIEDKRCYYDSYNRTCKCHATLDDK